MDGNHGGLDLRSLGLDLAHVDVLGVGELVLVELVVLDRCAGAVGGWVSYFDLL